MHEMVLRVCDLGNGRREGHAFLVENTKLHLCVCRVTLHNFQNKENLDDVCTLCYAVQRS
jgi:hypothetical protein